jgi:hypothetical protein
MMKMQNPFTPFLVQRRFVMKKYVSLFTPLLVLALLMSVSVGLVKAQGGGPIDERSASGPGDSRSSYIPIQGKLTDHSGNPLTGTYDLTVRLYEVSSGGTSLCSYTITNVSVDKGLFSTYANFQACSALDGRQLWMGIQVETDDEMTPRRPIDNVPYAWTLRPGATIIGNLGSNAIVDIENMASGGRGLRSYATSATGTNYGVVGASVSPAGYGGYFYNTVGGTGLWANSASGTGLYAGSDTGAAIVAAGTGTIKSSAQSSIWISGNGVHQSHESDTTVIDLDTVGGAKIYPGTTVSFKLVMLPITIPGPLYGQNVKVVSMDIYFQGSTDLDAITDVRLRRQTGACSSCYVDIMHDGVDHVCDVGNNPTGCIQHYSFTTNNTLTSTSGILYLGMELGFSGTGTWVDIAGVRLVLEHD